MKRNILFLYFLTLFLVFLSVMTWEFWLEPAIQQNIFDSFTPESVAERWEYVKTVFIFCAIALLLPALLALKIEKKRQVLLDSLEKLQKETASLLDERTIELAKVKTEIEGEKFQQSLSEISPETINVSLQTLIDSIHDSIMVIDNNYRVRMLNKTAKNLYFKDFYSTRETILCHKLSHSADEPCSTASGHECPFEAVRKTGKSETVEHYHQDKNGNTIPFEIQASPIFSDDGDVLGIIELARDVSGRLDREQKQREADARLLNLQREQSIANLAGGLAHEFNNVLTSILGNAELLSVRLDESDENRKQTEAIITGSEHLGLLTKQLLAYAKEGKYLNQSININEQLRDTMRLIYVDTFTLHEIEMDLTDNPWPILGDPTQISQLMMNLIINGFEAMDTTAGRLIIRTANMTIDEKWQCKFGNIHPAGDYVIVSVANTGPMISEEMLGKIFEPFFSTKVSGRGLGLAAAKGIVLNHNGCISVESDTGETTFKVILPREIPDTDLIGTERKNADGYTGLKVLVVDDEHQVLSIITSLLDHHKCNVLSTAKGKEALEIIERHRDDLDLVILDIQMPDITGDKVYSRLKKIKPGLKVLITSGHAEYIALKDIMLAPTDRFIKKPFRMSELMLSIKDLLSND
ncbi:response regulator [Thermodesulfobacteriota bacterium]